MVDKLLSDEVIEKGMNRRKVAKTIHEILDIGMSLLRKEDLSKDDIKRLEVMGRLGTFVSSSVRMIGMEVAQERNLMIQAKMAKLGYMPK